MHGLLLWLDGKSQLTQFLECNSICICVWVLYAAWGPWGSLCQHWGPCCHGGPGGLQRLSGARGEKPLTEARAATDTYVYKHIQLHVGDTCEQTQGVCDMLCDD